jgi:hypothetical protein
MLNNFSLLFLPTRRWRASMAKARAKAICDKEKIDL